jgi:ChpA-C
VQMKTRAAGVLAVAASAVAMMGAPAFASNSPSVGNITGNSNVSTLSGNNVQVPVQIPVNFCGNALAILGFADAGCQGGAAAFLDSFNSGS